MRKTVKLNALIKALQLTLLSFEKRWSISPYLEYLHRLLFPLYHPFAHTSLPLLLLLGATDVRESPYANVIAAFSCTTLGMKYTCYSILSEPPQSGPSCYQYQWPKTLIVVELLPLLYTVFSTVSSLPLPNTRRTHQIPNMPRSCDPPP